MEDIFLNGSCCNFHFVLKAVYPDAEAYFNHNHVITKIGGLFYDITGEVCPHGCLPIYKVYANRYKNDESIKSGPMYDPEQKQQYRIN